MGYKVRGVGTLFGFGICDCGIFVNKKNAKYLLEYNIVSLGLLR